MDLYSPTPLEQWIENLYREHHLTNPHDLHIQALASKLNVWFYFLELGSQAIERNGMYSICIDSRLSPAEQWEEFLHELCHVLRHSGNQIHMPADYMQMQETEANNFVLYAAIPYFMVKELKLPDIQNEAIDFLSDTFGVTHQLAHRRLEQIQRRLLQGTFDHEVKRHHERQYRKYSSDSWSEETRSIMDKLHQQLQAKGSKNNGSNEGLL